jgi:hypothetical protein
MDVAQYRESAENYRQNDIVPADYFIAEVPGYLVSTDSREADLTGTTETVAEIDTDF